MVPPTTKGGPIVEAMELANLGMLLHKLEPSLLLAILLQRPRVLVDVEGYVFRCGILPCLPLLNRVLLAVAALECLGLPVRHSMQTPSRACAHHDSVAWLWVQSNSAPSPCLLLGLRLPGATLCVHHKLVVHDTLFCMQQTMEGVQADKLGAAAHLLVGIGFDCSKGALAMSLGQKVVLNFEEIRPWAYWYAHRVSLD